MPIITKAGIPVKGSPTQFTLDKSALAAVTSVAADAYFSDSDNWKSVDLIYKSSNGKQKEIVKFDTTLASPTANFSLSAKALNIFNIHKIVIKDFDGDSFDIPRSALTAAEFDVDMTPNAGNYVVWDLYTSGFILGAQGSISKAGAVSNYGYCPRSSIGFAGNFEITFEALDTDILTGWCVGVSKYLSDPEDGANQIMFYKESGYGMSVYSGGYLSTGLTLLSGNNVFKLIRSGSLISFYLNNSLINTTNYSGTVYPEARVGGAVNKSSYIADTTYVLYDLLSPGIGSTSQGGVSTASALGNDKQAFKTTAYVGDFDISWNFDAPSSTSDNFFGVKLSIDTNDNYLGFVNNGGLYVYYTASGHGGISNVAGSYRIKRTGGTFEFYVNGSLVHSVSLSGVWLNPMYAVVRPKIGLNLISTVQN